MTSGDAPSSVDWTGFDAVFSALERRRYALVGPTVRDRAIVLEEIDFTAELPAGWTEVQDAVDEVSREFREFRARLAKPAAGRRAGPDAVRPPSR